MKISFNRVRFTIDGTNFCKGRDCVMCSGNCSDVQSQSFQLWQAKNIVEEIRCLGLWLNVCLTGGGETLLTPGLAGIVGEFARFENTDEVAIITSGFLPDEHQERKEMDEILKLEEISKIRFALSFHLLGKRFYERFANTLWYMLQRGQVKQVDVKMTYTLKNIGKTILAFQDVLCKLAEMDSEGSTVNEYGFDFSKAEVREFMKNTWLNNLVAHYSKRNAGLIRAALLTMPCKYIFRRENSDKQPFEAWLYPQEVSLFGKGSSLKVKRHSKYQCAMLYGGAPIFADKTANLHVGCDGYYYPTCSCPFDEKLRLGKAGKDPLPEVLKALVEFEIKTVPLMRAKKEEYKGKIPCSECISLRSI